MKTSCKIIEDLLPMYHDGVCSGESAALIEDHLAGCGACRQVLASLRGEFKIGVPAVDDLSPLEKIRTEYIRQKRRSVKRGACITLAVVAVLLCVWMGIWYLGYARHYDTLAGKLEKVPEDIGKMVTVGYFLETDDHCIVLKKPGFLGGGGFVRVGDKAEMAIFLDGVEKSSSTGVDLFFYPRFGGGYEFAVMLDDGDRNWWIWLERDLSPDLDRSGSVERTDEEVACIRELLDSHREEIVGLFQEVDALWGIGYLDELVGG